MSSESHDEHYQVAPDDRRGEYDACTFVYREDGVGAYTIMAVRFDEPNGLARMAGWRSGHVIFMTVDGGIRHCTNQIYTLNRKIASRDDESFIQLLEAIKHGDISFEEADGSVYHQEDFE